MVLIKYVLTETRELLLYIKNEPGNSLPSSWIFYVSKTNIVLLLVKLIPLK